MKNRINKAHKINTKAKRLFSGRIAIFIQAAVLLGLVISLMGVISPKSSAACTSTGSIGRAEISFNVLPEDAGPHSIWIEARGPASARVAAGVNSNPCVTSTLAMTSDYRWYKVNTSDLPNVSPGNNQVLNISVYTPGVSIRNARIDTTVPDQPVPSNDSPVVSVVQSNSTFTAPANYTITANASDANGIAFVDFYENNVFIYKDTTAPYTLDVASKAAGSYKYKAVAFDRFSPSASTTSNEITTTVNPAPTNIPPTVPIPTASSTSAQIGSSGVVSLNFSVKPTDSDGSIQSVRFLRNGTPIASGIFGNTGDYSANIEFTSAGTYNITAQATDNKGATTTSGPRTITISGGSTSNITGLTMDVFDGTNLSSLKLSQKVTTIDNAWEFSSPTSIVNPDSFSVRWTGRISVPVSGNYTFTSLVDDGVRLWVNGSLVIDDWNSGSAREKSGNISLNSGTRYDIKMEYYEAGGHATAKLYWSGPGFTKQIIPSSAFSDTTLPPPPAPIQPPSSLRVTRFFWEWFDCKINLAWNPPLDTSNLASYRVQRNNDAPANTTTTTWRQNGISCGAQTNTFRVSSVDKQGNVSPSTSITVVSDCPWFQCKFTTR